MTKFFRILLPAVAIVMAASCTSSKDIHYFQDIEKAQLSKIETNYEPVIMKDDKLQIIVSGPDKVVVSPYNFTLYNVTATGSGNYGGQGASSTIPYLVDSDGYIEMPGLGKLYVEGMRRIDLVNKITSMLVDGGLVKDPVVSVLFLNYKVTVLGEVRNPGTYTMDSERNTILQALGKAGDLLITANRDGILLIREENGIQNHHKIDLKNSDILSSPYFYLHQNDVIYVPQSPQRISQGTTNTAIWSVVLTSVTTLIAVVSLILSLAKK